MKNDYKYDTLDSIDTDYYVEKAYELRRAYLAELVKKAIASVKTIFANLTTSLDFKSASQN